MHPSDTHFFRTHGRGTAQLSLRGALSAFDAQKVDVILIIPGNPGHSRSVRYRKYVPRLLVFREQKQFREDSSAPRALASILIRSRGSRA